MPETTAVSSDLTESWVTTVIILPTIFPKFFAPVEVLVLPGALVIVNTQRFTIKSTLWHIAVWVGKIRYTLQIECLFIFFCFDMYSLLNNFYRTEFIQALSSSSPDFCFFVLFLFLFCRLSRATKPNQMKGFILIRLEFTLHI